MIKQFSYSQIKRSLLIRDAIIRSDFSGFKEDYLTIHYLIKKFKARVLAEIGTSAGLGTNVICKAIGIKKWQFWKKMPFGGAPLVFSIDVPPGTDPKIIYPHGEDGHPFKAGMYCKYPYKQLFGDSTKFDFRPYYPIDSWFIDGKHNFTYVSKGTRQALKSEPKLIIWHDLQIKEVEKAVVETMSKKPYDAYRVSSTRIGFAISERYEKLNK